MTWGPREMIERIYRYEGKAAQMILKNRITRHESRSPSSKVAGPSVPVENLSKVSPVKLSSSHTSKSSHGREYVEVHTKPNKKYLAVLQIRSMFGWDREDA